jgi:hypothetical protein
MWFKGYILPVSTEQHQYETGLRETATSPDPVNPQMSQKPSYATKEKEEDFDQISD